MSIAGSSVIVFEAGNATTDPDPLTYAGEASDAPETVGGASATSTDAFTGQDASLPL